MFKVCIVILQAQIQSVSSSIRLLWVFAALSLDRLFWFCHVFYSWFPDIQHLSHISINNNQEDYAFKAFTSILFSAKDYPPLSSSFTYGLSSSLDPLLRPMFREHCNSLHQGEKQPSNQKDWDSVISEAIRLVFPVQCFGYCSSKKIRTSWE